MGTDPQPQLADPSMGFVVFRYLSALEGGRPFGSVSDEWQKELTCLLAPAVDYLCGLGPEPHHKRFWVELPKGHDKTGLGADVCNFCMRYSRRPLLGVVAAAKRDQADLIRKAMVRAKYHNPHLLAPLEVPGYKARGPGGDLSIIAADEDTEQGGFPDFTIAEEVTVWHQSKGELLWGTLHGNHVKRGRLFLVLSNAGYAGSWQEDRYKAILDDPDWCVYHLDGKHASWMTDSDWENLRREMTHTEAARLLDNRWTQTSEEPLIPAAWLDRCMPEIPVGWS